MRRLLQRFALWLLTFAAPCPCGHAWSEHRCPRKTIRHPASRSYVRPVERHCASCNALIIGNVIRQADGRFLCGDCKRDAA